jgi:hypothetical protein
MIRPIKTTPQQIKNIVMAPPFMLQRSICRLPMYKTIFFAKTKAAMLFPVLNILYFYKDTITP